MNIKMWDYPLHELFERAGGVMWPILFCSILGLAIAIERIIVFLWHFTPYHGLVRSLEQHVRSGDLAQAQRVAANRHGPVARAAESYLEHVRLTSEAREDIVGRTVRKAFRNSKRGFTGCRLSAFSRRCSVCSGPSLGWSKLLI